MAGDSMSDDSMDMEGEGLSPVKSLGMCLRIESAAGCEAAGVLTSPLVAPGVSPASMKAELRAARLQLSAHGLMHRYVRSDVPPQPEALTACLLARLLQREVGSRANHRAWRHRRGSDAGGPLLAFSLPQHGFTATPAGVRRAEPPSVRHRQRRSACPLPRSRRPRRTRWRSPRPTSTCASTGALRICSPLVPASAPCSCGGMRYTCRARNGVRTRTSNLRALRAHQRAGRPAATAIKSSSPSTASSPTRTRGARST